MTVLYYKQVDATWPDLRSQRLDATRAALTDLMERQRRVVLARIRVGILAEFEDDFRAKLEQTLYQQNRDTAEAFARNLEAALDRKRAELRFMDRYLRTGARNTSHNIADSVAASVGNAVMLDGADGVADVFDTILAVSVGMWAATETTGAANFGAHEGASAAGVAQKGWQVTSANPRSSHSAMDGETVPVSSTFSNGMRWPGDTVGGPAETANCKCSLLFIE